MKIECFRILESPGINAGVVLLFTSSKEPALTLIATELSKTEESSMWIHCAPLARVVTFRSLMKLVEV